MMKITEDLRKAVQKTISSMGSISEFSRITNINIETLSRFLSRKTRSLSRETWSRLYPAVKNHLSEEEQIKAEKMEKSRNMVQNSESNPSSKMYHGMEFLTSDEKILLDAFAALPKDLKNQKLLEIVELARKQISNE